MLGAPTISWPVTVLRQFRDVKKPFRTPAMIKTLPFTARAKTTSIKQPKELATYSRDENGEYKDGGSPSFYYFPDSYIDRGFDLKAGFSSFRKIPEEQNLGDLKPLLAALTRHEQAAGEKVAFDIICFRGIMTKLLTLPYVKEPMRLKVITYDGHVLIKSDDEYELAKRQAKEPNEYVQKCEYSGYKFEKLVLLDKPWPEASRHEIESRHKKDVNNYEQYISVVKTSISKVRMVLGGEVDGIYDYEDEKDNLPHYIELKTNRAIENENQFETFKTKLFKTWAQCFLLGIRKIGIGFRDNNLVLRNIELFETDEVPILLKEGRTTFNCMNCLKFFGGVIEWLNELDKTVNKSYQLIVEDELKLVETNDYDEVKHEFLCDEFVNWREAL